ncbi:MAG: hypothetical protein K1X74_18205 [Pirellulales bacterium]|nr:hypothetical protein [Pirellulales bacterium]
MIRACCVVLTLAAVAVCSSVATADALQRLSLEKLRVTHETIAALASRREPVSLASGLQDFRAILHSHSLLSHDSRAPLDEIRAAAKKVGVQVILFSEHPADHYDYFTDGHRGFDDGLLIVPGAETRGFLAYPTRSVQREPAESSQDFVDLVRRDDGLIFVCHLEERLDWELDHLTGNEIYNTHADFMEEKRFTAALKGPLGMFSLVAALEKYPQEVFGAIQDYPSDYLAAWDRWCQKYPHTGVAGNDSHHNQAYRGVVGDDGQLVLSDALGAVVARIDPQKVGIVKGLVAGKPPGTKVFEVDLDPYERSYHHVSTHLLMPELSQAAVWDALKSGRCYVGFDWIADPTGFVYQATRGDQHWLMGSQVAAGEGLRLAAEAPLGDRIKLLRNGEVVLEQDGRKLDFEVTEPGVYRVEVWLKIAAEPRIWILSNPIYVGPAVASN